MTAPILSPHCAFGTMLLSLWSLPGPAGPPENRSTGFPESLGGTLRAVLGRTRQGHTGKQRAPAFRATSALLALLSLPRSVKKNSGGSVLRGGVRRIREPAPPVAHHAQDSWRVSLLRGRAQPLGNRGSP
jgi:hypothetical protein